MPNFCRGLALLKSLFLSAAPSATVPDPMLKTILAAFDEREEEDDTTGAHRDWIATEAGREACAYLAEHYEQLPEDQKYGLPLELARTGKPEVVPLIRRTLKDPDHGLHVLSGIYYACWTGHATEAFRRELAPELVHWIGRGTSPREDRAIELLPQLDRELAAKTLLTDEFMTPDALLVDVALASCNEAVLKIPLSRLQLLLEAWKTSGPDESSDYRIVRGYREALLAFAVHRPNEAMEIAEAIVRRDPRQAEYYSKIPLAAAGLTGLYARLCDHADDPARFSRLPEAARIYYAVAYFEADSSNGGVSQALGNSTGDHLPWVMKGYKEIGDARASGYLEAMLKPFGPKGPASDRARRVEQMESMKPDYWTQEDDLGEAWLKQAANATEPQKTEWLLNRYARRNAVVLKPLLTSMKPNENPAKPE